MQKHWIIATLMAATLLVALVAFVAAFLVVALEAAFEGVFFAARVAAAAFRDGALLALGIARSFPRPKGVG